MYRTSWSQLGNLCENVTVQILNRDHFLQGYVIPSTASVTAGKNNNTGFLETAAEVSQRRTKRKERRFRYSSRGRVGPSFYFLVGKKSTPEGKLKVTLIGFISLGETEEKSANK